MGLRERHVQIAMKNSMLDVLNFCRDDPDLFNELFLKRPPYWSRQKDLCRSVVEYRTTVAYSGNMIGKDYWIAGIVLWWLLTRPKSLCIITGPSQMVLGSVTFKEIRRCLERGRPAVRGQALQRSEGQPGGDRDRSRLARPGVQHHQRGASVGPACRASSGRGRGSLGSRGFRLRRDRLAGLRAAGLHRQSDPGGRQVRRPDPPGRPRPGRQCAPAAGRQRHPDSQHRVAARPPGEEPVRAGRSNLAGHDVPQVRQDSLWVRLAHRRPHPRDGRRAPDRSRRGWIITASSSGRRCRRPIPCTAPGGSPATWPRASAATAPASWSSTTGACSRWC